MNVAGQNIAVSRGGATAGGKKAVGINRKSFGEMVRKQLGIQPLDLQVGLDLARDEEQGGGIGAALRIYMALALCEPCDVERQIRLSACAIRAEKCELALATASLVIALAPADPRGYLLSGEACLALRHLKEAKEDLTNAIEMARRTNDTTVLAAANELLSSLAVAAA